MKEFIKQLDKQIEELEEAVRVMKEEQSRDYNKEAEQFMAEQQYQQDYFRGL